MILKSRGIRTGSFIALGGAIVAAIVFAGVSLAGAGISHQHSAPTTKQARRLAAERGTVHAKAGPAVVPNLTYPAEGIDVPTRRRHHTDSWPLLRIPRGRSWHPSGASRSR